MGPEKGEERGNEQKPKGDCAWIGAAWLPPINININTTVCHPPTTNYSASIPNFQPKRNFQID